MAVASNVPWRLAVSNRSWASAPESLHLHAARESLRDLLQDPYIAVGVRERCSAEVGAALRIEAGNAALARFEVPDLADFDAAADQVLAGGLDVVDDEEQARPRTGVIVVAPCPNWIDACEPGGVN